MAELKNVSKQLLAVSDGGGRKEIAPGQTVEVDDRTDWDKHLFVRAGWLQVERQAKRKPKGGQKPVQGDQADKEQSESAEG